MRRAIAYATGVLAVALLSSPMLNPEQLVSLTVFTGFILGSLLYWPFRNAFALAGVALLLGFGVLDVEGLIEFSKLEIILFLVSMMIVVGYLEEKGFFEWLIDSAITPLAGRPRLLIYVMLVLAAVMAALVDEVTSILFMMAIMIRVLGGYGIRGGAIMPYMLFLVFTTNIGSSALPVGNPIGVMIAFEARLSVEDFIRWPLPLMVLNTLLTAGLGVAYLSKFAGLPSRGSGGLRGHSPPARKLLTPIAVFVGVLAGLVTHSSIEELLGLEETTMLLGVPMVGAGVCLMLEGRRARDLVEKKVDWWTLLYFLLLFASVGTLEHVGITELVKDWLLGVSGGDLFTTMLVMGGVAGVLTALMDNVLAIATMIPVVKAMEGGLPFDVEPVWWALLISGTYIGNATVIGSTANIVAAGFVERRGYGSFSMLKWILIGVPVSISTFALAVTLLYLQLVTP